MKKRARRYKSKDNANFVPLGSPSYSVPAIIKESVSLQPGESRESRLSTSANESTKPKTYVKNRTDGVAEEVLNKSAWPVRTRTENKKYNNYMGSKNNAEHSKANISNRSLLNRLEFGSDNSLSRPPGIVGQRISPPVEHSELLHLQQQVGSCSQALPQRPLGPPVSQIALDSDCLVNCVKLSTHKQSENDNFSPHLTNFTVCPDPLLANPSCYNNAPPLSQRLLANRPALSNHPTFFNRPALPNHPTLVNRPALLNRPTLLNQPALGNAINNVAAHFPKNHNSIFTPQFSFGFNCSNPQLFNFQGNYYRPFGSKR